VTEGRPLLQEEAGNRLTEKLIRQDATDPKQKAVTDYKEQVDRHIHHPHPNHRKTKKQENQYNHNGHNNQKPNQ